MNKYCKNCGTRITENDEFCPDCGAIIDNNTITCKNCGKKLKKDSKFCPDCGNPTEKLDRFCPNCGSSISPAQEFCTECGSNLANPVRESFREKAKNDRKVIVAAIAVIAVVFIGALIVMVGTGDSDIPLVEEDFEVVSMLVPEGSYFVETDSLPSYGDLGGYVSLENAGDYYTDVGAIMFSTIEGGSEAPLEEVALERVDGDVHIYKDRNGADAYFITRQVGPYEINVIGSNENAIVKMLKSAEVTSTTEIG